MNDPGTWTSRYIMMEGNPGFVEHCSDFSWFQKKHGGEIHDPLGSKRYVSISGWRKKRTAHLCRAVSRWWRLNVVAGRLVVMVPSLRWTNPEIYKIVDKRIAFWYTLEFSFSIGWIWGSMLVFWRVTLGVKFGNATKRSESFGEVLGDFFW